LETCCGYGYDEPRKQCLPRFSRVVARAPNTAQRSVLCQPWQPSLRAMRFHGVRQCLHAHMRTPPSGCQGKEKSLLGARSNVSGLGSVTACAPRAHAGMLAGFPFGAMKRWGCPLLPIHRPFGCPLGSPHPRPIAVRAEPFPTSVFKALLTPFNTCYYHQDLHYCILHI